VLRLVLFVVPLGLDTFAVAAALGTAGLPQRERLRVGLAMAGFEMAMPLVGLAAGHGLGRAVGGAADWLAIAVLAALGVWMLTHEEEDVRLPPAGGLALVALGLSVSLDELAMGFAIGLLRLSLWLAIVLIGAQAFLPSQVGLRLGARIGETLPARAGRLAARRCSGSDSSSSSSSSASARRDRAASRARAQLPDPRPSRAGSRAASAGAPYGGRGRSRRRPSRPRAPGSSR
jgi:manganese efflux pump family protein